ncbi:hypothetical protein [Natronobiforma cellulositropha]|uniref:hypothetical protein n=1 Tax=Natronobiforma cellulositropha TaxID=1679076 RepID=UPI0021D58451|nr:hypothetical protein [Natronobiforma cellulositropha]
MDQQRFVTLALLAFGLVVASFVLLGTTRIVVGYREAQLVSAPVGVVGFSLLVSLSVRATLAKVGLWPIDSS